MLYVMYNTTLASIPGVRPGRLVKLVIQTLTPRKRVLYINQVWSNAE